jgi:hypothetical protein
MAKREDSMLERDYELVIEKAKNIYQSCSTIALDGVRSLLKIDKLNYRLREENICLLEEAIEKGLGREAEARARWTISNLTLQNKEYLASIANHEKSVLGAA